MRQQTARAGFGFVEPPVPAPEARQWRNHYAHSAARRAADARIERIRKFRLELKGASA